MKVSAVGCKSLVENSEANSSCLTNSCWRKLRAEDYFWYDEIEPSFRINLLESSRTVTASSSGCCKVFRNVVSSVVNPGSNQRSI